MDGLRASVRLTFPLLSCPSSSCDQSQSKVLSFGGSDGYLSDLLALLRILESGLVKGFFLASIHGVHLLMTAVDITQNCCCWRH